MSVVVLFELLLSFARIGALSFGGAYAALPLVEREVVSQGWMSASEFADLMAIDELTCGPILINSATFVGMRVAGLAGALAATLGCVLVPCLVSLALICLYRRYRTSCALSGALHALGCMTFGLIASTLLTYAGRALVPDGALDAAALIVVALAYWGLRWKRLSPAVVVVACGCVGLASRFLLGWFC